MALTYDAVERLFNAGEYAELLQSTDCTDSGLRSLAAPHRILIAHALTLTGDLDRASRLMDDFEDAVSSPLLRSRAQIVRGSIADARSAVTEALDHFQAALRLAHLSDDPEQIAWAQLRLFRHVIDTNTHQAAIGMLPEVRRAATRAGNPHISAYLHLCVAVLEGQQGRVDEARRHCDLVDALLVASPNALIAASNLVNRSCLAILSYRFQEAMDLIATAKNFAGRVGLARSSAILASNLGQLQLVTGQFSKAAASFSRVESSATPGYTSLGAAEGLARVYLAENHLDRCEETLRRIESAVQANPSLADTFHCRWAAITRARLLMKANRADEAVGLLDGVERRSSSIRDVSFRCAIHMTIAQALGRLGDTANASRRICLAYGLGITEFRELQGQYYFASSSLLRNSPSPLSEQLRNRAVRLWAEQGVVSLAQEMQDEVPTNASAPSGNRKTGVRASPASLTESFAAVLDLAHTPRLLGAELLEVIAATGCSEGAELKRTRNGDGLKDQSGFLAVPLGMSAQQQFTLVCPIPEDPGKAVALAAISRIARAAVDLERVREMDRSRAALWPADLFEYEAGALFIADEMRSLVVTAQRVASTNVPVLITGETGTGKEVLARTIHAYSNRVKRPFLPFNCTSTPRDMLDSQLFGHRRGSFTGATENFQGIIRAAASGTLFLDEIGDMALDIQPKLLRFLESGDVHPVGETQPVHVDVRVIAATNANLDALVTDGRFREDLFYRLNIVRLHLPALRERRVEIPALATHFLQKHAQEYGKGDLRLAEETMEYLMLYRWPGNVRQLANEMRRMAALCESGAVLMPEHLSPDIAASRRTIPASERTLDRHEVVVRLDQPLAAATEHLERAMLQYALQQTGGRIEETASLLGVSRKGLYLKRQRFGIEPPATSLPPAIAG